MVSYAFFERELLINIPLDITAEWVVLPPSNWGKNHWPLLICTLFSFPYHLQWGAKCKLSFNCIQLVVLSFSIDGLFNKHFLTWCPIHTILNVSGLFDLCIFILWECISEKILLSGHSILLYNDVEHHNPHSQRHLCTQSS